MTSELITNSVSCTFDNLKTKPFNGNRRTILTNKNLLIDAANILFSEIAHLKRKKNCADVSHLRKHLLNEIHKFQIKAETLRYDTDNILISRYAISATIDEIISQTHWGKECDWQKHPLLQELQQHANADEHFFTILDRICRAPNKFIDNIELMYTCLSLGFTGKFRHQPQEKLNLQKIIDATYKMIRAHRDEIDKRLSPTIKFNRTYSKEKYKTFPIWRTIIIAIMLVLGIYGGFNYKLKTYSNKLIQQIQSASK
ncbi:MAG: type IVB secretion system protein IcmH/DotU [Gammaproteobacteria bacterium]|jgi:type VI secretion system protein ImpK